MQQLFHMQNSHQWEFYTQSMQQRTSVRLRDVQQGSERKMFALNFPSSLAVHFWLILNSVTSIMGKWKVIWLGMKSKPNGRIAVSS